MNRNAFTLIELLVVIAILAVIHLHAPFAEYLRDGIQDPEVRRIASLPAIGGIDLLTESTDLLSPASWQPKVKNLYE